MFKVEVSVVSVFKNGKAVTESIFFESEEKAKEYAELNRQSILENHFIYGTVTITRL